MTIGAIKSRLRRLERQLPGPITVLLDDGSTATLPPRADIGLLVAVIGEGRTGLAPPVLERWGDVIDRIATEQGARARDGSIMPLLRVLREGMRDLREQHDEHQLVEETT
jgi:hypothetical protein